MRIENEDIQQQVQLCRRLANATVDNELRHSLQELAEEYEKLLPPQGEGFMLVKPDLS